MPKTREEKLAQRKEHRSRNKERLAKEFKIWYDENKEEHLKKKNEYRRQPEVKAKDRAVQKKHYEKNREEISKKKKEYRKKPEVIEYEKAYSKKWDFENKDKKKRSKLLRQYGIDLDQFNSMILEQDNKCACCGLPFTKERFPCVDHDHRYEKGDPEGVRAIVCNTCNVFGLNKHAEMLNESEAVSTYFKKYGKKVKINPTPDTGCRGYMV